MELSELVHNLLRIIIQVIEWKHHIPVLRYDSSSNMVYFVSTANIRRPNHILWIIEV